MAEMQQERRRARRVDANLSLQVTLSPPDGSVKTASLQTINISSSGVYFRSDHFLEPMTKLALDFEVAVSGDSGPATVQCEGLVVRTTPEAETEGCDAYEVAVFFSFLDDAARDALEQHIALLLDDSE